MAINFRQKSNLLFAQLVGFGGLLTIIFLTAFYKIYIFVFSALGEIVAKQANAACGCQAVAPTTNYTFLGLISFVGISIVATFIFGLAKIIISIIRTNKFLKEQKVNLTKNSQKLAEVAKLVGLEQNVIEIGDARPLVFCHGTFNPKIYTSSGVVNILNHQELKAVLLHETHHLLAREPAKLLYLKFLGAFAFIPGVKSLIKKYLSFSEIAADELATNDFTEKNQLASAMAKILDMEERQAIRKGLALSYFSQITEDRIMVLTDTAYKPTLAIEMIKIITSIASVVAIALFFSANMGSQQARAQNIYADSGCATNKIYFESCRNAWTKCAEHIYHQDKIACQKGDKSYLQR